MVQRSRRTGLQNQSFARLARPSRDLECHFSIQDGVPCSIDGAKATLSEGCTDLEAANLTLRKLRLWWRDSLRSHLRRCRQLRRRDPAMSLAGRAPNEFPGQRVFDFQRLLTIRTLDLNRHKMPHYFLDRQAKRCKTTSESPGVYRAIGVLRQRFCRRFRKLSND